MLFSGAFFVLLPIDRSRLDAMDIFQRPGLPRLLTDRPRVLSEPLLLLTGVSLASASTRRHRFQVAMARGHVVPPRRDLRHGGRAASRVGRLDRRRVSFRRGCLLSAAAAADGKAAVNHDAEHAATSRRFRRRPIRHNEPTASASSQ